MASKLEKSTLNEKLLDFDNLQKKLKLMQETVETVKKQKNDEIVELKKRNDDLQAKVKIFESKADSLGSLSNLSAEKEQPIATIVGSPQTKTKKHRPNRRRQKNRK